MTETYKLEKATFNVRDLKEYLIMKNEEGNMTDLEYGLYVDLKNYGSKAINMSDENYGTYRSVMIQIKEYYG